MKKLGNIMLLITFVLLICLTLNVNAATFDYYLSNSESNYEFVDKDKIQEKSVKRGDIISVVAVLNNKDNLANYQIKSGKLTIRWDEKFLSLVPINGKYYDSSITNIEGLTLSTVSKGTNKLTFNEIRSTGFLNNGKNKIVEVKFKVLDTAKSESTKIYQMDGEDSLKCYNATEEHTDNCGDSLYSELKYVIEKSTVNKLSSIKIDNKEFEFFNEDVNDYELEVESDVEKIDISVTKKDERSTISGNYGENAISYGTNKFVINVISEAGTRNTYNIIVTKEDKRSRVNTLKTLTISSGELKFNPDTTEYDVIVENEIDKVTITSSLTDEKSKYVEDFQSKEIELMEGSNKVEIKVISEIGEEKVYTININRSLSSNNSLKSLKVNNEKIELQENIFTYNVTVDNEVDEAIIIAKTNDEKATIKLDDKYPLQVGNNEIQLIVTAASGEQASYTVNVIREKMLSTDSLLTSIKIKGYEINFKPSVTLYYLKVKDDVEKLEITTTTEDPNAEVIIEGNENLENGSIIKINVQAEDKSFTRYFINIEKGSTGISPIIYIIGGLFVLLGVCIGIIFYRKKSKEKKQFDKFGEDEKVKTTNEVTKDLNENINTLNQEENTDLDNDAVEINEDVNTINKEETVVYNRVDGITRSIEEPELKKIEEPLEEEQNKDVE